MKNQERKPRDLIETIARHYCHTGALFVFERVDVAGRVPGVKYLAYHTWPGTLALISEWITERGGNASETKKYQRCVKKIIKLKPALAGVFKETLLNGTEFLYQIRPIDLNELIKLGSFRSLEASGKE